MKDLLKVLLTGLILLVSCEEKTKKEDRPDQERPEKTVMIPKERKDMDWPDVVYSYTLNKDTEVEFEEVYTSSYESDRFNQENASARLDGVSDYISIENHTNLNPTEAITISIWYKPDAFKGNGNNAILSKGFSTYKGSSAQYALTTIGNKYPNTPGIFKFFLSINGTSQSVLSTPNTWAPGQWYLLTGTFDGKKMKLYVNDQLAATRNIEGKIDAYDTPLLLGKTPHKEFYTSGNIDDLKLFNRALSKEEITKLYANK